VLLKAGKCPIIMFKRWFLNAFKGFDPSCFMLCVRLTSSNRQPSRRQI